jgi:hypothetical protein
MNAAELKEMLRDIPDHWKVCIETAEGDDISASPIAGRSDTPWEHTICLVAELSERGQTLN